jgi:hypothetical protein
MRFDHLPMDLVCPTGVVPNRGYRHVQIRGLGPGEGLAVIECFQRGQFVRVLLYEVRQPVKELSALRPRDFETPRFPKGAMSGLNGAVDIFCRTLCDGSDYVSGS